MFRIGETTSEIMCRKADVWQSKTNNLEDNFNVSDTSQQVVEGEMELPDNLKNSSNLNTLDEDVKDTIKRDLKAVGIKFVHVLYPKQKKTLLKDWDLWGPLILCVFLAMKAELSSLELSTFPAIALEVFKCFHNLNPSYMNEIVIPKISQYNLRNTNIATLQHKKHVHSDLHFFSFYGAKIWNAQPNTLQEATTITMFKKLIKTWSGISYM
ncbi:Protein YIPF6 [Nymphon striatum]|nr:Protein YIPF6 [Nymphon striatum]